MGKRSERAGRALRRSAALFLALRAVFLAALEADPSAAAARADPELAQLLLRAELPSAPAEQTLSGWPGLVLREVPFLLTGPSDTAAAGSEPAPELRPQPVQPAVLPETPQPVIPQDVPEEEPEPGASGDEGVRAVTLAPTDSGGYDRGAGVFISNRTDKALDVAAMAAMELDLGLDPASEGPEILIMHTHGSEAYTMSGEDQYRETDTARTTDTAQNVVRIGDEMERIFTEQGFSVLHDRTLYDYPSYNGSYDRSKAAVEAYLEQYPTIRVVLDVHRDALVSEDGTVYKAVTEVDGVSTAQVELVMGSDAGGLNHPRWQENLALAVQVQRRLSQLYPTLMRPISLRQSRYNQQLTPGSLLVEIGCHGNTLQEALAAARLFARGCGQVLLEQRDSA